MILLLEQAEKKAFSRHAWAGPKAFFLLVLLPFREPQILAANRPLKDTLPEAYKRNSQKRPSSFSALSSSQEPLGWTFL